MIKISNLILIFLVLFSVEFVSGAGIVGVSPSTINFDKVLRGGYAEGNFLISFDSKEDIKIVLSSRGDIAEWINFTKNETILLGGKSERLYFSINPPSDTPNGIYNGFIVIGTSDLSEGSREGHATSVIKAHLEIAIRVEITDLEVLDCEAKKFEALTIEEGDDFVFEVEVFNTGNVKIKPEFRIDIWDREQTKILKSFNKLGDVVLPTGTQVYNFRFKENNLEIGQYWVSFDALTCTDSTLLTFDVLEEGALRADGLITSMFSVKTANVSDTIPIIIVFKNTGQKEVTAQFNGQVERDGKIFQLLESEETITGVNDFSNFTLFFTPDKAGNYIARGRVFYDKKKTFESSVSVEVLPIRGIFFKIALISSYVIIIALIVYLFYRITLERRRRLNFLR